MKFKRLNPAAKTPIRATPGSACYDIFAVDHQLLVPGKVHKIRTGLAFEIPEGHCMVIYSRSSMFLKNVLMTPTVIDSDYRGEVYVLMRPMDGIYEVNAGDRIAQFKIERADYEYFEEVGELVDTARGAGGLGSTGA